MTAVLVVDSLVIKAFLFNMSLIIFAFWIIYAKIIAISRLGLLYIYTWILSLFYL